MYRTGLIFLILLTGCCPVVVGDRVWMFDTITGQTLHGEVQVIMSQGSGLDNCRVGVTWADYSTAVVDGWRLNHE